MTAAQLVVWRHGQTEWNATERMQGQTDVPLDEIGWAQAREAAARLATLSPAQLWSSDLSRASQTAQALADVTGLPVRLDRRLREIDAGRSSGLTVPEYRERFGEVGFGPGPDVRRGGDGETEREVAARVCEALVEIVEGVPDGGTVVVASHGVACRVGVGQLVGLPADCWRVLAGVANCCWVVVGRQLRAAAASAGGPGSAWRIVEWNAGSLPEPLMSDDDVGAATTATPS